MHGPRIFKSWALVLATQIICLGCGGGAEPPPDGGSSLDDRGGVETSSSAQTPSSSDLETALGTVSAPKLVLTRPGGMESAAASDGEPRRLVVAPRDLSGVGTEVEPNDDKETASPLDETFAASGALEGKEKDFFHFTTEGEPQLWLIEARGRSIREAAYVSAGGRRVKGRTSAEDPSLHTLANLFLLPGEHWLELRGREGSGVYTVRAVPLGPPDPGMELEPNDEPIGAHELHFGTVRRGHLFEEKDVDYYRFNLNAEEHLALRLKPASGVATTLRVESSGRTLTTIDVPGDDGALEYRALLPAGQVLVRIRAERGRSDDAYELSLDRLNPYLLPVDLEPNDTVHQARPLPDDLMLRGVAAGRQDLDWYRLPPLTMATTLTATPTAETRDGFGTGALRLYDAAGQAVSPGIRWDAELGAFTVDLPANTDLRLRLQGFGPYEYAVAFVDGPVARTVSATSIAMVVLPGPHRAAAFWHEGQRLELPVMLRNASTEPQTLRIDATSSHYGWQPDLETAGLTLRPDEQAEVALTVRVSPDAWADEPVHVTVRARDEAGAVQTAATQLIAECGAPPVGAAPDWPMPEPMLGGLNLAWADLGSRFDDGRKTPELFDGATANNRGWFGSLPATIDVELAGEQPAALVGVLLNPKGSGPPAERAKDFTLSVSLDGTTYIEVASGSLSRLPYEQAFGFERVEARAARLTIHSNHRGNSGRVYLGELKVVAAPEERPDALSRLNLADPERGGHLVWSDPVIQRPTSLLTDAVDAPRQKLDGLRPFRWVVGFHHGRAARIEALEWVQPSRKASRVESMGRVQLAVSVDSPTGPWTPLAAWDLDRELGSVSELRLPSAVWARYVRFTHSEATERGSWHLPETLRVFEQSSSGGYRSILGEWGHQARAAVYEYSEGRDDGADSAIGADAGGEDRETARPLELGETVSDQVELDRDVDWFKLEIPSGHNRLILDLSGRPAPRAVAKLFDADGEAVELVTSGDPPVLEAIVDSGESYFVQIEEPPRSIVFAWDNSGSVAPYRKTIYQAITSFSGGIRAGHEFANLLPFQQGGGDFLLEDWTDQPHLLQRTINDYDQRHSSSNAEAALIRATDALGRRPGSKAILLLTDAATPGYTLTANLWSRLREVRPRIFTLELRGGGKLAAQQDLMQSWAAVAGGYYTTFSTHGDLEVAFERASCLLRRPAHYALMASTRFDEPPDPGRLSVKVAEKAVKSSHAIELILDASGSMLQRLEGKRRIDVARDVLLELVTETLPEGTPLALRIFGHREAGSCRTDLEVPLAPLDRDRVAASIRKAQAMNLAKTPIAESLRQVAKDLATAEGQRLVVLITDGEETCDGDPTAAVAELTEAGFDVRLNIVGFAIDDESLKADFARWADLGGGRYFDAADEAALGASMGEALRPKFQVVDVAGTVVAEGTAGGDPVELPAGTYSVKVLTSPLKVFETVKVEWEEETELTVD